MYTSFDLSHDGPVAHICLNQPKTLNSMTNAFWREMVEVFQHIDTLTAVRAVVISSTGKHFTAGLDLAEAAETLSPKAIDSARANERFRRKVLEMQESFSVIDRARVPVISVIQGGCIGGGVDLVSACDIRLGTKDCFFSIQEINIGIVADVGTLQRLPTLLPQGLVRELAYTGRRFKAEEALHHGFINRMVSTQEEALAAGMALAHEIACKSPLAITGIKHVLNHGRGRTVEDGLHYVATWNAGMLMGQDLAEAMQAHTQKRQALFTDLV